MGNHLYASILRITIEKTLCIQITKIKWHENVETLFVVSKNHSQQDVHRKLELRNIALRYIALRNTDYVTHMNSIIAIICLASFTFMQLPTATWLISMESTYAAKPSSLLTYLPTQEII